MAEHIVQAVFGDAELAMQVRRAARLNGEAFVEALHEGRKEGVAVIDVVDTDKPQLLHQPILQRAVGSLDAALRLTCIGTQDLDVEFGSAAELVMRLPPLAFCFTDWETECSSE